MKKLILAATILIFFALGLNGCKKSSPSLSPSFTNLKSSNQNIPTFRDFDQVDSLLAILLTMDLSELHAYEANTGRQSIYSQNYAIYELLDLDSLDDNDEDKVYEFADEYNNSVWIFTNEDQELEFAPRLIDNDYSLIVGTNRVFQVGDYVYKVFEDGLAYCKLDRLNDLFGISGFSLDVVSSSSGIETSPFVSIVSDGRNSCSFPDVRYASSNNPRERLKLKHEIKTTTQTTNNVTEYRANAFARARNYRRIGWIWYHAKRTITGQLKFEVEYSFYPIITPGVSWSDQLEITGYSSVGNYYSTAVYSRQIGGWRTLALSPLQSLFFKSIDSSVKNPSTQTVSYICN